MPLKMVYMKWFTEIKLDSFILKREKHIICQRIGLKLFSRYDENKKSKKRIWNMRIIVFLIGCLCGMSLFSLRAQQVWNPDNQNGTFTNPIMWGDWPDPDLIRVDDKFYLVSTSMHYVPKDVSGILGCADKALILCKTRILK